MQFTIMACTEKGESSSNQTGLTDVKEMNYLVGDSKLPPQSETVVTFQRQFTV